MEIPKDHAAAARRGYMIGASYRSYGGGVDVVIGAAHREDWRGDTVIVRGEDGRVREHCTPCGKRDRVTA